MVVSRPFTDWKRREGESATNQVEPGEPAGLLVPLVPGSKEQDTTREEAVAGSGRAAEGQRSRCGSAASSRFGVPRAASAFGSAYRGSSETRHLKDNSPGFQSSEQDAAAEELGPSLLEMGRQCHESDAKRCQNGETHLAEGHADHDASPVRWQRCQPERCAAAQRRDVPKNGDSRKLIPGPDLPDDEVRRQLEQDFLVRRSVQSFRKGERKAETHCRERRRHN